MAAIFHWTPAALDVLTLVELMEWRERARQRSGANEE
ncbi:GpE family phage tail protein [Chromobacterium alkanivorans]